MLTSAAGLTERDLDAIADLERRVVAADGGRLKLEWGTLRSRSGERVDDLLWWEQEQLRGFLGLYRFGSATLELAGMVDPLVRRRGIGSALLRSASGLAEARGCAELLIVAPRSTPAGRGFAIASGATLAHSEHYMELRGTPADTPRDPDITVRPATVADEAGVRRVVAAAFGDDPSDVSVPLSDRADRQLVVERAGAVVGALRLSPRARDATGIYGFAVDPGYQGRGIGREALRRVSRQVRDEGAERVTLEVATTNERALGLYTSVGFERVATEDYYLLSLRR